MSLGRQLAVWMANMDLPARSAFLDDCLGDAYLLPLLEAAPDYAVCGLCSGPHPDKLCSRAPLA